MLCVYIQVQGVSERSELAPCNYYNLNDNILAMIQLLCYFITATKVYAAVTGKTNEDYSA